MANYTDSTTVQLKLVDIIPSDIDSDIITDALSAADDIINDALDETTLTETVPNVIKRIATYYACVELLDGFTVQNGKRNEIATAWERKADKMLKDYKQENTGSDPVSNYSRNNTSLHSATHGMHHL